jgi:hypothetical protein
VISIRVEPEDHGFLALAGIGNVILPWAVTDEANVAPHSRQRPGSFHLKPLVLQLPGNDSPDPGQARQFSFLSGSVNPCQELVLKPEQHRRLAVAGRCLTSSIDEVLRGPIVASRLLFCRVL